MKDSEITDIEGVHWNKRTMKKLLVIPLVRRLEHSRITPDQITIWLYFVLGMIGIALLSFGIYIYTLIGAIIFQIALFFDEVDGSLARLRKKTSLKGVFLDKICYSIHFYTMFFAIGLNAYNTFKNPIFLMMSTVIIMSYAVLFYNKMKLFQVLYEKKKVDKLKEADKHYTIKRSRLKEGILEFFRPINPLSIIFFLAIFNVLYLALFIYLIIAPYSLLKLAINLNKKYEEFGK